MAPDFETLRVSTEGTLGSITLARPKSLNALSRRTLQDLAGAARWFAEQRDVRVVVVSGEGRSFSAGFDLNDFANPDANFGVRETADLGRIMAESVTAMPQITVAAIQGHCIGGGLVLAASCDLRVAAESAVFSIPEVDLGIPLAWGGIPRLVREIGPAAKAIAMTPSTMKVTTTPALELMIRRKKLSMERPIVPLIRACCFRGAVACHQAREEAWLV